MSKILTTEFKVGLTVLVSSLVLILSIIWGKEFSFETNKYEIQVIFENVGGMVPGDPVTVNGVKEGKIKHIGWQDRNVLCTLEINDYVQLYEDATFVVISAELLAGMKVEIDPGKSTENINLAHQPFKGKYGGRIVDVGMTIDDLARDLSALSFRLDTTFQNVNNLLHEGDLQNNLKNSLENINEMTNALKTLPEELHLTLMVIKKASVNVDKLLKENDSNISGTFRNLNVISMRFDTLSASLGDMMDKITRQEGTLGKMVNDTALYQNLNRTLLSIDSLAQAIKKDGVEVSIF